jgi:hypothetical protein
VEVLKFVVKEVKSNYLIVTRLGTIWGLWETVHTIIREIVLRKMLGYEIGFCCRSVKYTKCPKFISRRRDKYKTNSPNL